VQWISHKVRKGETLAIIAKRYDVSVQVLREMNKLSDPEA
jgi:LysM repeat protein